MNYLQEAEKRGLDLFQMQEVREGLKNLTAEQVDLYAWPKYDHMQMQEIRLGLEHGLSREEMSVFLDPRIGYKQMNYNRIKIENSNVINEKADAELRRKKYLNVFIVTLTATVLVGASYAGWHFRDFLFAKFQHLEIRLKDDSVTLGYGEPFNPADYIASYTEEGTELILPEAVDTSTVGEQTVIYKLKNPQKMITAEMAVVIVDDKEPVIVLNAKEDTLIRTEDEFSCRAYLSNAYDQIDGDLTDQVICSEADESLDEQIITYTVEDSSGNQCEAELLLKYEDPVIPETPEPVIIVQEVVVDHGGSSGGSEGQSHETPSQQSEPVNTEQSHGSQSFMFSDGYDMDSGYSACVAAGEQHGSYSCEPIMNDEGIYSGYKLNY